jgi:hypothetical protein
MLASVSGRVVAMAMVRPSGAVGIGHIACHRPRTLRGARPAAYDRSAA